MTRFVNNNIVQLLLLLIGFVQYHTQHGIIIQAWIQPQHQYNNNNYKGCSSSRKGLYSSNSNSGTGSTSSSDSLMSRSLSSRYITIPTKISALSTPSSSSSSSSQYDSSSSNINNSDDTVMNHMTTTVSTNNHHHSNSNTIGRILEGGKVIDFSNVKASSKAELALAEARQKVIQVLQQQQQQHKVTTTIPMSAISSSSSVLLSFNDNDNTNSILGINQDVIDQVGHELGTFCSNEEVQDCAAYLRSLAPSGLFNVDNENTFSIQQSVSSSSSSISTTTKQRYEQIIQQSYEEAGEVTSAFAKTFYMGTMLMSEHARRAIWAIYVWCRRTDEIVDAPRTGTTEYDMNQQMLLDLSFWEMRLEQLWYTGTVYDVYDICLLHTRIQYPTMDIQPFMDMIRGMLMDVPDLGIERYNTFDELHLYCYRVAGTVGVMSLPVFGCANGYNEDIAREPALSLGVAFQLTNILRDVGEDAKQRGRIYLPQEDLIRFGVTEEQIFNQHMDDNYRTMMKYQIERARMYYARARRGVFMLAEESRLPVQSSLDAYGRILDKIEENNYDSLTKRAYVDKWEKLSIIPFSWYRTTDISRTFPLPGDTPVDLTLA